MTINIKQSEPHRYFLIWAILCSISLHILFVLITPNLKFTAAKEPPILEIELATKPAPPPISIQPEPVKPPPKQVKPKLAPKIVKSTPVILADVSPNVSPPSPVTAEPTPVVPTIQTKPPPLITTPPVKQEPEIVEPNQSEMNAARTSYGNTLWDAIGKYKNYPKVAQMRGWQGETVIELLLDGKGSLQSKRILKSSGHEVLDKEALAMVDKATPFPPPPETLRAGSFSIKIPIPFRLE